MNRDFAAFLCAERRRRQFSQVELARRAQISERTLRYWETGTSSPGRWELESILSALELTALERAHALSLLPTPRSMDLFRREAHASLEAEVDLGSMPMLGDLLQAMRLRCGMSQEEMAAELKIARTTILRWETTETLPSGGNLERICALLHAYPEERAVLAKRRLKMPPGTQQFTLDECVEQVEALDLSVKGLHMPLIDLRALTLKRQIWPLARQSQTALRLLARVHVIHALWLMLNEREREAEACLNCSLNLLRNQPAMEMFWQTALNTAAQCVNEKGGGDKASLRLIEQYLPLFSQELRTTLWCDMAFYAGHANRPEEAETYLNCAREVLPHSLDIQKMTEVYYPVTYARVLMNTGRPIEAMNWLPGIFDVPAPLTSQILWRFLWTEALLGAGEHDCAQRQMDDLHTVLVQYPMPRYQRKFQALASRF